MGQHAERVPFPAREDHLSVHEGGAGLRQPGPVDQHRGPSATTCFFLAHEVKRLSRGRHRGADERRRQRLQGHSLRAIDDRARQVLVAQARDPAGKLPTH